MTVWATSDLHVGFDVNRRAVEALPARPDDWLIVAGDTGDTVAQLEAVLDVVTVRFARVIWTPGNHDLWTPRQWPDARRGEAHYRRLVEACRVRNVATPEDPFLVWPGPVPVAIAPCFTLYDYSFAPAGLSPQAAVDWAAATGVQCADEVLLSPAPYETRGEWCAARVAESETRLAAVPAGTRIALVNHYPLRPDLAVLPRIPRFTIWCGTTRTADWHRRYPGGRRGLGASPHAQHALARRRPLRRSVARLSGAVAAAQGCRRVSSADPAGTTREWIGLGPRPDRDPSPVVAGAILLGPPESWRPAGDHPDRYNGGHAHLAARYRSDRRDHARGRRPDAPERSPVPSCWSTRSGCRRNLSAPNLRIVDLRPRGFDDGHIPGAVWLDNNAIRVPNRPPTFLPTPAEFSSLMQRLGISNQTRVVAYDERGGIYAARLWWILNHYGHANVALLDGGWTKWSADQLVTTTAAAPPVAATFTVKAGTVGVATADDVKAAINNRAVRLIDARTQNEIDGKDLRGIKRGGFIESSIPVYWEDTLDPTLRTFKSPAEIAAVWRSKGVLQNDSVLVYCQVGMRASHDLFTLALLGHDLTKLRNYYGAWEEWGNREDTPIKTKD